MSSGPADEQHDLREAIKGFAKSCGATAPAPADGHRYDEQIWRRVATELGLPGIGIPEEFGGAGAGWAELAVAFEETGAALLPTPLFATVALAAGAVLAAGDRNAMAELLPGIAEGSLTATLILNGELGPWDADAVQLTLRRRAGGFVVDGSAAMVIDGMSAEVLLVAARSPAGISLAWVRAGAPGISRAPLTGLDHSRPLAAVDFTDVPATLIGAEGHGTAALATAAELATVALCAEQLGGAQRCLDSAVAYAGERIQFGRAIGSFQAVKHRCADMLIDLEGARSALQYAVQTADDPASAGELPVATSVAGLAAGEAFLRCALDNMRIHGGIGFTWEHDAHRYFRRAKAAQLMFGDPAWHTERLARLVGEPLIRDLKGHR